MQARNPYLDFLIDPGFQGVNRLFALLFQNKDNKTAHAKYYLRTVEINDYNVMIAGKNVFRFFKINLRTYDNIWKT